MNKIVSAGEIKPEDIILEIGPGKGALTEKLLGTGCKVLAIEKDRELFEFLKEKFAKEISEKKLILLNEDILEFSIKNNVLSFWNGLAGRGTRRTEDLTKTPKYYFYKVIANIPYNITGAILKKFLTEENQPERMVLMVQNEVAKRIVARDGKESILSVSVKAYGEPKMVMKVPARYFSPAPKVDSAVIAITNISRKNFNVIPPPPLAPPPTLGGGSVEVQGKTLNNQLFEVRFWEIVKAGFAHKRKKLSSNLKTLKYIDKSTLEKLENKRAEELTLMEWMAIAKE